MPNIPLVDRLPAPVHRAVLRVGERLRRFYWKARKPRIRGVALVPRDASGAVLLVRHSYRAQDEWQLVTGGVDRGESHEHAAHRELAEEVGLTAAALEQVLREDVEMHGAVNDVIVYAASVSDPPSIDFREIAEACFFATEELPANMSLWARRYVMVALEA